MKKIVLFIGIIIGTSVMAQSKNVVETQFFVDGKCEMCEKRIENILDTKGIINADWDLETKQCKVVFRKDKITEDEIHKLLSNGGHDTQKMKASDDAYNKLHHCCKYERKE